MYIICIAWTTYSRWNLFCSILSYFHASHFCRENPSWFARQNKTQPSDRQCPRSPARLRNSSSISADCFDQGVPCLRRQDVLHGLPSNHKALIFIETQAAVMLPPETLEEGKTMVEKTSRRCRRICAIFQAGRVNFFTSLREKHALSTCDRKLSTRSIGDFFGQIVAICNMNSVFCTSILAQFLYHLSIRLFAIFAKNFCLCYSIHCAQMWENLATAISRGILFNTLPASSQILTLYWVALQESWSWYPFHHVRIKFVLGIVESPTIPPHTVLAIFSRTAGALVVITV